MGIWIPHGKVRGRSKGAFRGKLTCPVCSSEAIRFIENVAMFRIRYRCRKCGMAFQYDTSNVAPHPYAPFKKNKFQRIVERWERGEKNANRRLK